jgi:hypothetical protein
MRLMANQYFRRSVKDASLPTHGGESDASLPVKLAPFVDSVADDFSGGERH